MASVAQSQDDESNAKRPMVVQTPTIADVRVLDSQGRSMEARRLLRELVEHAPTTVNIAGAARMWASYEDSPLPGDSPVRIALLGSGTLDPLGAQIRVAAAGIGLHPSVYVGQFDQWAQDLLVPDSDCYRFAPHMLILAIETAALFPRSSAEAFVPDLDVQSEIDQGIAIVIDALGAAAKFAPRATIVLNTFSIPDRSPLGLADLQAFDLSQRDRIDAINRKVAVQLRETKSGVVLFDTERAEARFGKSRVRDLRRWYVASVPYSDEFSRVLALEYMRVVRPLKGLTRKCLVVDLDNTLWGGVVGEDGALGVKVGGSTAPGNAFRDLQLSLENLRRRGILLAVCSKNNESDAMEAIANHPGMILRPSSFAAMRINWEDKASNLVSIANELNIGLDSLVFLDDNPAERGLVKERLPEVLTVDLPRDPALYASAVEALDVFESLRVTEEDRRRSALYAEQRQRAEFERALTSTIQASRGNNDSKVAKTSGLSAYLFDLGIKLRLGIADDASLSRVAQLTNKTNQFNVTTHRYTEAEIREMAADSGRFGIYTAHVSDRFGDSGLTGVAIVLKSRQVWEIDTFLLSCRVLGRGIERSFLRFIATSGIDAGAELLRGTFIATPRNAPAADFYQRMGLTASSSIDSGDGQIWELVLGPNAEMPADLAANPGWIDVATATS